MPQRFRLLSLQEHLESELEVDGLDRSRHRNELADMTLTYTCDLSEIFNKAMDHDLSCDNQAGTRPSNTQLSQLYRELQTLHSKLPMEEECQTGRLYEHYYLW